MPSNGHQPMSGPSSRPLASIASISPPFVSSCLRTQFSFRQETDGQSDNGTSWPSLAARVTAEQIGRETVAPADWWEESEEGWEGSETEAEAGLDV
jgi:hypothetical protein